MAQMEEKKRGKKKKEEKLTWQQSLVLYMHDLVYMLIAIILLFLLVFRVIIVSGDSMNSTLIDGDYLLLTSSFLYRNPQQGDIIVASKDSFDDGAAIIKRVIATEGQTVDIDFTEGIVYVDGVALDEPYTKTPTNLMSDVQFPLYVPEGYVFVLGDNRNDSKDSRFSEIGENGLVNEKYILGKAVFRLFPLKRAGKIEDIDGGLE